MTITHRLCGYNKRTEVLEREVPVPSAHLGYVSGIAAVDRDEDPDVIGAYPIPQERLGQLGDFLTGTWDRGNYDWFLVAIEGQGPAMAAEGISKTA